MGFSISCLRVLLNLEEDLAGTFDRRVFLIEGEAARCGEGEEGRCKMGGEDCRDEFLDIFILVGFDDLVDELSDVRLVGLVFISVGDNVYSVNRKKKYGLIQG